MDKADVLTIIGTLTKRVKDLEEQLAEADAGATSQFIALRAARQEVLDARRDAEAARDEHINGGFDYHAAIQSRDTARGLYEGVLKASKEAGERNRVVTTGLRDELSRAASERDKVQAELDQQRGLVAALTTQVADLREDRRTLANVAAKCLRHIGETDPQTAGIYLGYAGEPAGRQREMVLASVLSACDSETAAPLIEGCLQHLGRTKP